MFKINKLLIITTLATMALYISYSAGVEKGINQEKENTNYYMELSCKYQALFDNTIKNIKGGFNHE